MSCSEHRRFHRLSDYRLDMLNSDCLPAINKNLYAVFWLNWEIVKLCPELLIIVFCSLLIIVLRQNYMHCFLKIEQGLIFKNFRFQIPSLIEECQSIKNCQSSILKAFQMRFYWKFFPSWILKESFDVAKFQTDLELYPMTNYYGQSWIYLEDKSPMASLKKPCKMAVNIWISVILVYIRVVKSQKCHGNWSI